MAGDESVMLVDGANREVGAVPRSKMRAEGLAHRATYIVVRNHAGEVFAQARATSKDLYPGWYDLCAGGVLRPGEKWLDNAVREVDEELGVRPDRLRWHGVFRFRTDGYQVFGGLFSMIHEGPFHFSDGEVTAGRFLSTEAVARGDVSPITPDSLAAWRRVRSG